MEKTYCDFSYLSEDRELAVSLKDIIANEENLNKTTLDSPLKKVFYAWMFCLIIPPVWCAIALITIGKKIPNKKVHQISSTADYRLSKFFIIGAPTAPTVLWPWYTFLILFIVLHGIVL